MCENIFVYFSVSDKIKKETFNKTMKVENEKKKAPIYVEDMIRKFGWLRLVSGYNFFSKYLSVRSVW